MYEDDTLQSIRQQLDRVAAFEMYADRFDEAGVDVGSIDSWESFRSLPFTTQEDLVADREQHGPEGTLAVDGAMLSFTPTDKDLFPVFDSAEDLRTQAKVHEDVFERIGVTSDDLVLNTFGYHLFGTGILLHRGFERLGATVIPAGPGESEQTAGLIETYDVDVLVGNPSFALKMGEYDVQVDTFIGGGEPFTSVPGLREEVKAALNCETAVDYFGSRRASPIAVECRGENGLHIVEDNVVVEIVDPDTGEQLPAGERGELVVTHVAKHGSPLVRYRTGDLAELREEECPTCGANLTLPEGVIGRTDDRLKVKGVKVYPQSIETALLGIDGLTGNYRIEITRPKGTDAMRLICEGTPEMSDEELSEIISNRLLVRPDELQTTEHLEDETGTFDHRF